MLPLDKCYVYSGDIKRLTKSNSTVIAGRIIYVVKKDYEEKSSKIYWAYDYKTKKTLGGHSDKEFLLEFLKSKEKEIGEVLND